MTYVPRNLSLLELKKIMKKAVPKELKKGIDEYLEKYTGKLQFLDEFLQKMGTDNIFEALLNMQILQADFGDSKSGTAKGKSMSNQTLYKTFFEIRSKLTTNNLISGYTLLPKIIKTFKDLELVSGNYKNKIEYINNILLDAKNKKENERTHIAEIQKSDYQWTKTIEEIFEDEEKLDSVQSYSEKKQIQHVLGLNKEILETYKKLDALIAENVSFIVDDSITDLPLDPSGNTLNYIQKLQDRGEHVEDIIIEFKDKIKRKTGYIDEDRRKYMWTVLQMYELRNRKINPKDAIGGFITDIEEVTKLDETHEVIQKIGMPRLSKIKDILNKKEMTMFDLQRFLDTNIINVRVALNEWYFKNNTLFNKFEYENTITYFKDFFDSEKNKLGESVYDIVLSRKDKKNLTNMIRTETDFLIKERNRFESRNHKLFKERINGIALVTRKQNILLKYLKDDVSIGFDENITKTKKELAYLRKNSLKLVEEVETNTMEEITTRILDYTHILNALTLEDKENLRKLKDAKIFDESLIDKLKEKQIKEGFSEYQFLESLKSKEESKEISDVVISVNNHELVMQGNKQIIEKNHYTKEDYDKLKKYFDFNKTLKSEFENLTNKENLEIKEIKTRMTGYKKDKFITIGESKYVRLSESSIREVIENKLSSWKDENYSTFKYLKKENIKPVIEEIDSIQELDLKTTNKLETIVSFKRREILSKEGYNLTGVYYQVMKLKNESYKITQQTKKVIDNLYDKVENKLKN